MRFIKNTLSLAFIVIIAVLSFGGEFTLTWSRLTPEAVLLVVIATVVLILITGGIKIRRINRSSHR